MLEQQRCPVFGGVESSPRLVVFEKLGSLADCLHRRRPPDQPAVLASPAQPGNQSAAVPPR